jgi:flavodoxin
MKTALIVYWSHTGNTEKVALAIKDGLSESGFKVDMKRPDDEGVVDFFDYDLVCIGSPSYQFHLPKPMDYFLKNKLNDYRKRGLVKIGSPRVTGKNALIFCTYSGPHTGINEAIPAGKYMGQFFEHLGFTIVGEWYVLGEFHGWEEGNVRGRMGDIRGKPTREELQKIQKDARQIADGL